LVQYRRVFVQSIRILTAGAWFSAALLTMIGGAAAQTPTDTKPGQPIQLLQKVLAQPAKRAPKTHHGSANGRTGKVHTAVVRRKPIQHVVVAQAAPPVNNASDANVWPAVPSTPPADVAAAAPQSASAVVAATPSALVVGGHTVQVASPDDVNEMDLAATDMDTQASAAAPWIAAASKTDMSDIAQPKSDAVTALAVHPRSSEIGTTSWLLQVMAALGGAIAAGAAAWLLIGSTPQRMYA
jgi:hypothetical protein